MSTRRWSAQHTRRPTEPAGPWRGWWPRAPALSPRSPESRPHVSLQCSPLGRRPPTPGRAMPDPTNRPHRRRDGNLPGVRSEPTLSLCTVVVPPAKHDARSNWFRAMPPGVRISLARVEAILCQRIYTLQRSEDAAQLSRLGEERSRGRYFPYVRDRYIIVQIRISSAKVTDGTSGKNSE